MTDTPIFDSPTPPRPARKVSTRTALIAAGLLGLGVAGGAAAVQLNGPSIEMAPATPAPITSLKDDGGIVTVRGRVVEAYGPMFVLADASGRALVDAGRQGDGTGLAPLGSAVSVQGHFHHGIVHASFLVGADGKVTALHPFGPPRGGPGGPEGPRGPHHGPRPMDGPDGPDGDGPPPPPPGATTPAAVPAAAPAAPVASNSPG